MYESVLDPVLFATNWFVQRNWKHDTECAENTKREEQQACQTAAVPLSAELLLLSSKMMLSNEMSASITVMDFLI